MNDNVVQLRKPHDRSVTVVLGASDGGKLTVELLHSGLTYLEIISILEIAKMDAYMKMSQ